MNLRLLYPALMIALISCGTKMPAESSVRYAAKTIATPEPFAPGIISTTNSNEFNLCFSPDGRTAYFTRRTGDEKQKIWRSSFVNRTWTYPEICSFSTDRDEVPFLTPDGNTLYFGSTRPVDGRPSGGNFDMNIWKVERDGNDWTMPTPLDSPINAVQEKGEEWPSSNESALFTKDGINFLYSTMLRGTKSIEIYQTTRDGNSFSKPVKIDGLFQNEKLWKSSPVLSPDGNYLLFNAYGAEGGAGGEDIFICKKTVSGWTGARNIGTIINTKAEEGSPRFSPDGKYFFFGREVKESSDKDGLWDIYYMETKYLRFETLFNP